MVLGKQLILLSSIHTFLSVLLILLLIESIKLYFKPVPTWNKWKLKPTDFYLEFDAALSKAELKTFPLMRISCSTLGAGRIRVGRKITAMFMDKRDCWPLRGFFFPLKGKESPFLILKSITVTWLLICEVPSPYSYDCGDLGDCGWNPPSQSLLVCILV